MKVLILANNDVGLYKFRKELIQELLQEHSVTIALPEGEFVDLLTQMGCEYINIPIDRRGINPFKDFNVLIKYMSVIKKEKPDVVLTYTIKPTIYGGLACRLSKTDYIVNITGLGTAVENPGRLRDLLLKLYKVSLKKANCVFFQNEDNKKFFEDNHLIDTKTILIPGSGVNIETHYFENYPETESYHDQFLFVGRIMKDKGVGELLEVVDQITYEYPNVQFNIVGGKDEELFSEKITELESRKVLKYWGQQKDVHDFYKKCNAVVLPSYHEGMANVLLEASATGRPVIASNIPGCKETFEEGVTGLGFEPKNSYALYNAIKSFVEMPYEEKAIMGKKARDRVVQYFDRNIVIQSYTDELKTINKRD